MVNAVASVRDTNNPRNPLATRSILLGLDSYSDVTVAHRDIVYNVRAIHERLSTGGGATQYFEEGLVDLVDGPCSFRTIPALVAHHPSHLPSKCLLLLGVPQINELDIKLDTHRRSRRLPLESYDPTLDFSADTHLPPVPPIGKGSVSMGESSPRYSRRPNPIYIPRCHLW